ncbi:MAG: hypothetical protein IKA22_05920 [Lentisphaeria bacterium]|nr:hypothetical protein [Lentisphaeria bacterium]
MLIKQLSLFVENKPGSLYPICKVLKDNNISIRTLSLADTEQFGILRLLVKEWEKARDVLSEAGFIVKVTDVIALPVADRPGGLAELLEVVDKHNISVEYMYAFTFGHNQTAVMVFRFENPEETLKYFHAENIDAIEAFDLFK